MYHVQIVDDEPIVRKGISKMLDWHALGFEISCLAQNGKEALEQLEVEEVDLVITDIEMPLMDGLSFIKEIRETGQYQNKEIIILTAYDNFDYAKAALRYKVSSYILKPVNIDELTAALKAVKEKLDKSKI